METYAVDEVIVVNPIDARRATEQAKRGASDLWEGLAKLVEMRGWHSLGYPTFTNWARCELDVAGSTAFQYLTKTTRLLELARSTGLSIGELEPEVKLRRVVRKTPQDTLLLAMRSSIKQLDAMPMFADPTHMAVARQLRDSCDRLLKGANRCDV